MDGVGSVELYLNNKYYIHVRTPKVEKHSWVRGLTTTTTSLGNTMILKTENVNHSAPDALL